MPMISALRMQTYSSSETDTIDDGPGVRGVTEYSQLTLRQR
jgi:hypothetical protein